MLITFANEEVKEEEVEEEGDGEGEVEEKRISPSSNQIFHLFSLLSNVSLKRSLSLNSSVVQYQREMNA
jgi:hypothetical protein